MTDSLSRLVHLVRHVGDSDVEIVRASVTRAEALAAITEDFETHDETDLDMVSVETGRFVSWMI